MKEQTKQLIELLDELNQTKWKEIYTALKDVRDVFSVSFNVFPSDEALEKFKINKDINFSIKNTNGNGKMNYYYKGMLIEPDCYYVRPDNYQEVSLLEILHECIVQDTYKPDIKKLEAAN